MTEPNIFKKISKLAKAVKKHAEGGFENVEPEEYANRLQICSGCEFQKDAKCIKCGCFLNKKAWWATEDCPIGKWPKQS